MRRFSILGMMGFILVFAVGLTALRNANDVWAGILLLLAVALLGGAVLGASYGQGRERAWWAGFALFEGGYLLIAFGPFFADRIQPKLATTQLLTSVHRRVAPLQPLMTPELLDSIAKRDRLQKVQQDIRRKVRSPNDPALQVAQMKLAAISQQIMTIQSADPSFASWMSGGLSGSSVKRWRSLLPGAANHDQFLGVGHCLFAFLAGLVGAVVACRLQARRERSDGVGRDG